MKPQIFISSVSRELRTARQLVANTLHALGYEPVWQDIFETSSEDIRPMLRRQIDSCSAVLQIVGHAYGAEPPTPDAMFGRCSYTQYEALYARSRKRPVYYLIAENDLPRDAAAETIDTPVERTPTSVPPASSVPPGPGGPGHETESEAAQADATERQRLQSVYRQGVLTAEQVWYPIHTPQETELSVRRLRDDLSKLRRGFRSWMVGITAALVLIAGGIAWINLGQQKQSKVLTDTQQTLLTTVADAHQSTSAQIQATGQQTTSEINAAVQELKDPTALAESIRQEIRQSAEAKIKALPDEKGRGKQIAEIEKERDLALGRVDDLIKLIQEGLKEGASPVFQRASEIMQNEGTDEALAYLESSRPSTLETVRRQNEQIKSSAARLEAEKEERNKTLQALMLEAELLETKLQWKPALQLREQVAELAPDWFEARITLGMLHYKLARFQAAEPLLREAVKLAGNSKEETWALCDLAELLKTTNRLVEAEPLMRRALALNEQSFGAKHPDVAINLNNLALLLQATNRLAEAEPLMRRALAINEQFHGPRHPDVARSLGNLAQVLQATKRLAEAEPLMRRALALDEQSYEAEHPNVALHLNNLAQLLQNTNRMAEAEPLMRRALAIDKQSYEPEHPNVAVDLNNLAGLLHNTKRLAEAEPLMRRALAIDEQSYGPENPDVARDLNNLTQLLQATNRLAEAEPLMRRCVTILHQFGRKTGHEHPSLQTFQANYRGMLQAMKLSEDEIAQQMTDATSLVGPLPSILPEVERLLGPAQPVSDVLAALDRQYQTDGKPAIYFLPPKEPIAPHLDELLGKSKIDLPLDQPITPQLDKLLGPAKSTKEVFENLDRQYREQNKPPVWYLPLTEPISPHLDELLGPVPAPPEAEPSASQPASTPAPTP